MRTTRLSTTDAIVLRRRDFGECDRLLTVFTPHAGKSRVVAKGVRRITSRMAGHLELFTHARLQLAKGRNLDIVTQCQTLAAFPNLRQDLNRVGQAHYLCELVDRLTPEHLENRPLFSLLLTSLQRLDGDQRPHLSVRLAEMQVLRHLGYSPQLYECIRCGTRLAAVTNAFSVPQGGTLCPHCALDCGLEPSLSVSTLKLLRLLQADDYATLCRLRITSAQDNELAGLTRALTCYHLERETNAARVNVRLRSSLDDCAAVSPGDTAASELP